MWLLPRPPHAAGETFEVCISRIRNPGLKARLEAAALSVVAASAAFDLAATQRRLHTIPRSEIVAPDVTVDEMSKVYTQSMARKEAPGRAIYDAIFASAPQGRCPLCVQRHVTTLDHHLPKAYYPALVVAPLNLVPACADCNKAKLAATPTRPEDVALHPYYDDLGNDQWLVARVVRRRPAAVKFQLAAPQSWDPILVARVRNHFQVLKLAQLYASQAADELVHIRHQLEGLHNRGGAEQIRDELRARAMSSAAARPNSWRAATYQAWAGSDWFCDGGFRP